MKMKKLLAIVLAATALTAGLMLTACSASPEEAIEADLAAQFDPIVAAEEAAVEGIASNMGEATAQLAAYGVEPNDFVLNMIEGLDYEITAITVDPDGETATADVTVTCKSFVEMASLIEELTEEFVENNDIYSMSETELEKASGEIMMQALKQTGTRETSCQFNYELVDGTWSMTADGEQEIANAFLD